ncbi:hypothetical protein HDV00_011342 [Rhizophlyctis rosea]|nr:hypothetical protein HDV00_011342 [Rhizophlyctis rosea]
MGEGIGADLTDLPPHSELDHIPPGSVEEVQPIGFWRIDRVAWDQQLRPVMEKGVENRYMLAEDTHAPDVAISQISTSQQPSQPPMDEDDIASIRIEPFEVKKDGARIPVSPYSYGQLGWVGRTSIESNNWKLTNRLIAEGKSAAGEQGQMAELTAPSPKRRKISSTTSNKAVVNLDQYKHNKNTPLQMFFLNHIRTGAKWDEVLERTLSAILAKKYKCSATNDKSQNLCHTIAKSAPFPSEDSALCQFLRHLQSNDPTFQMAITTPADDDENGTPIHTALRYRNPDIALHLINLVTAGSLRRALTLAKTTTQSSILHVAASWGNESFVRKLVEDLDFFSITEEDLKILLTERCAFGNGGSTAEEMAAFHIRQVDKDGKSGKGDKKVYGAIIATFQQAKQRLGL